MLCSEGYCSPRSLRSNALDNYPFIAEYFISLIYSFFFFFSNMKPTISASSACAVAG